MEKITVFELAATLVALFFSIFAFNTVLVQVEGQTNDGTVSNLQSNKKSTDYEIEYKCAMVERDLLFTYF
jgi:hypothetical protein